VRAAVEQRCIRPKDPTKHRHRHSSAVRPSFERSSQARFRAFRHVSSVAPVPHPLARIPLLSLRPSQRRPAAFPFSRDAHMVRAVAPHRVHDPVILRATSTVASRCSGRIINNVGEEHRACLPTELYSGIPIRVRYNPIRFLGRARRDTLKLVPEGYRGLWRRRSCHYHPSLRSR
jgi:hypothetical protein